jgi:hypothetical protein
VDQALAFYGALPDSEDLRQIRVIVYENPMARSPINRAVFRGPYDPRFRGEDGSITLADFRRIV